jgi:hypothetical protein
MGACLWDSRAPGRREFQTSLCICYILYVEQWGFRCNMSSGHREGGPRSSIALGRHVRCSVFYCKVVVEPGTQLCTLLEVWVLGVGMSTLDAQTASSVRRGSGALSSSDGPGTWQNCGDSMLRHIVPRLIGPDFPSIETRQLDRGFQIDMFRSIRVDHPNCLQVAIKTHSFEGGFGVSFNCVTKDTAFYTTTSRLVVWIGPFVTFTLTLLFSMTARRSVNCLNLRLI